MLRTLFIIQKPGSVRSADSINSSASSYVACVTGRSAPVSSTPSQGTACTQ